MRRLIAWLLVALALAGGSASAAAGALGLGLRRRSWPIAATLLPEVAGSAAVPGIVGALLAALAARLVGGRAIDGPRSANPAGRGPVAWRPPSTPGVAQAAAAYSLGAAIFAGWPLLLLPFVAARFERAVGRLTGQAENSPGGWSGLVAALAQAYRPGPLGASRSERGIVYRSVDGEDLMVDLYRPLTPGLHPLIVMVHGGGWYSGDRHELPPLNRYLAGRGYAVAALDYRLAPAWTYPAPLEDVQAAVAFLAAHAGDYAVDPSRVVLMGRSAGGHLALMTAYGDAAALGGARVAGVVAYYAATDLAALARTDCADPFTDLRQVTSQLIGAAVDDALDRYHAASPLTYAARRQPPTLLVHGARDATVPVAQSRALAAALERAGNPVAYLELPWSGHGFDFPFRGLHWLVLRQVLRFLAWATAPSMTEPSLSVESDPERSRLAPAAPGPSSPPGAPAGETPGTPLPPRDRA
jgi:acetyl esterase/lipase